MFYREANFKDTEIGRIPKEWEVVRLGKVLNEIKYGVTASVTSNSGIPVLRVTDINDDGYFEPDSILCAELPQTEVEKYRLKVGDLVIARSGATAGKVAIYEGIPEILCFASYLIKISPKKSVFSKFLFYFLNSEIGRARLFSGKRGSAQPNINSQSIKAIKIPLPPLEEQQKIAHVLMNIDKAIEAVDEAIAKAERIKKGLIQELLTRGIGHTEFKETPIGKIPKTWKVKELRDVANIVSGFTFPLELQGKNKGKYPFVKVGDLNKFYKYVVSADNYVDDEDIEKLRGKPFPKGTIIFPKIGMAMRLNRYRILGTDALFDNNVAGVIPTRINNEFLYYYLVCKVDLIKLAGTTTVPSITKSRLQSLKIPFPALGEQRKIAEILSSLDDIKRLKEEKKKRLVRMKRKLMDLLLTGKVRVSV